MQKFSTLTGVAAPLPIVNLDTDQIIPKQFLTTVEREGLGKGLLYDLRFDRNGKAIPDFVLNQENYQGAVILIGVLADQQLQARRRRKVALAGLARTAPKSTLVQEKQSAAPRSATALSARTGDQAQ